MTVINDNNDFNVRYTNRDIMDKLNKIHEQTRLTNGRVTELEKRSIGVWVVNNPISFIIYLLIFFSIVISDVRHPLINLLASLL